MANHPISGWITASDAAHLAGLNVATLRVRRFREGDRHARHVQLGNTVLYDMQAFHRYLSTWTDGRCR